MKKSIKRINIISIFAILSLTSCSIGIIDTSSSDSTSTSSSSSNFTSSTISSSSSSSYVSSDSSTSNISSSSTSVSSSISTSSSSSISSSTISSSSTSSSSTSSSSSSSSVEKKISMIDSLVLNVGETYKLEYEINFTPLELVSWLSENESIATVSNEGLITAKKEGNTKISIIVDGLKSSCNLIVKDDNKEISITMYGINDFHGSTVEKNSNMGILKYGTFLKQKGQEENTVLINSGDMWQGSLESNYNHGELLTYAMNDIGFDCFTLGNHEFDWGAKYITSNMQISSSTPFLASNIYHFDIENKKVLDHADELGEKYTIKTLESGLKVGIIGVIGSDQITSISSQFADEYTFINPEEVIKEISDDLRVNKGVDIVVVSAHASAADMTSKYGGIAEYSSVSNKKYADVVFCAHSHQYELEYVNDVPFIQASSNGVAYSKVTLNYSKGQVQSYEATNTENLALDISEYDTSLSNLYNKYKTETDAIGSETLAYVSGTLYSSGTNSIANLVVKAIADEATTQGFNIDYSMCNNGRASVKGNVTYADLYSALPFDNEVFIVKALGSEIRNEAKYSSNYIYRINEESLDDTKYYTIAVIDYLALHRNSSRNYDYFPSAEIIGKLTKDGQSIYNYRDITHDYLLKNSKITASDYSKNLSQFKLI